jgi:hypothetical protein
VSHSETDTRKVPYKAGALLVEVFREDSPGKATKCPITTVGEG